MWWKKYERLIRTAAAVAVVYIGFRWFLPLFFPFVLAYGIAWLIRKPVRRLYSYAGIRPEISSGILLAAAVAVLGTALVYAAGCLVEQIAAFVGNYGGYRDAVDGTLKQVCCYCDGFFGISDGSTYRLLGSGMESLWRFLKEEFLPSMTKSSLRAAVSMTEIVAGAAILFVATILFSADLAEDAGERRRGRRKQRRGRQKAAAQSEERTQYGGAEDRRGKAAQSEKRAQYEEAESSGGKTASNEIGKEWKKIREELSSAGIAYLKTQLTLMLMVSAVCSIGFFVLRNPYALLFGLAVGIFDAFPVLGSGLILVPWAVVRFFQGSAFDGAVLLTMYGACQLIRQYLEPKLLGGKIGIRPVYSLMAIYIGYELFGFSGIFLGPIGLVLIRAVLRAGEHAKM